MTYQPPRRLDLSDRCVLISGGAGALGQFVSATLAAAGATVVVNDVLEPAHAAGRYPDLDAVHYLAADVAEDGAAARLLEQAETVSGRLPDVVCCHAGRVDLAPVHEFPLADFDEEVRVNLRGSFVLAQAAARRWLEAGVKGNLIFTSSWVQDVPWPEIAPYNATKAAVKSLMRSFARELAPAGIRANAVAPGMVAAGMALQAWETDPDYRRRAERAIPLGFLQPPQSVADAFLFLASELSSYMTGAVLLVDGGASLYPMD